MPRAIVVARDSHVQPDTTEVAALADAAGYEVVDELTQRRREDPTYCVGRGKAESLMRLAADRDADAVVFDEGLDPGQAFSVSELMPDGVRVLDRHRLVLDIFVETAGTREARLQVKLATLRYELQRLRVAEETTHMQRAAETGSRTVDHERRVRQVERELDEVVAEAARRRRDRRADGFDLVALAGYTNAGKSTLLHRLADDLSVADREPAHNDFTGEAEVADRLFETLETTTRRATVADRPTLVTDTVGFAADLPHDLLAAFRSTLEAVADADVGVLVVDGTDDPERLRAKVETTTAAIADHEPRGELLVALNKMDAVPEQARAERRRTVADAVGADVLAVSAAEGDGIADLRARIAAGLPTARERFDLPNDGDAQALLSWAYDRGSVENVAYEGDSVRFDFEARPDVVERARNRTAGDDGAR
ncbi:MAG: GTPase HflX [Halolamina sp.]